MPIKLSCEMCRRFLGEINKGGMRHGSVSLCEDCWDRARLAVDMADSVVGGCKVRDEVPEVVKDLFGKFGVKP